MLLTPGALAFAQVEEADDLEYPESNGQPLAVNTTHYDYLTLIKSGLECLFADRADVFVAGDLLWYPVQGRPDITQGPDVLVAFGRPKGHRSSYQQWREAGVAPQVVFEILSPHDEARAGEAADKFLFYKGYGVEEYYLYDPANGDLHGWRRVGSELEEIPRMEGWTSPRLGIRFAREGIELQVYGPDGRRFLSDKEQNAARIEAERLAEAERERAEAERERAEAEQKRAAEAIDLAARLAAQLRALGVDPKG